MTNEFSDLAQSLRSAEVGERTAFCPEDMEIAAYFDCSLEGRAQDRVALHLAGCSYCRTRVGLLARLDDGRPHDALAEELLARAKQLSGTGEDTVSRARPPGLFAWAAAAVVVLALGFLLQLGPSENTLPETRTLRTLDLAAVRPMIVYPAHDASLVAGPVEVRWTGVEGSVYYEVLVLDDAGKPLLSAQRTATWWRPEAAWTPQPGGRYYLRVTAHLRDGRTASSEHVAFSVPDA